MSSPLSPTPPPQPPPLLSRVSTTPTSQQASTAKKVAHFMKTRGLALLLPAVISVVGAGAFHFALVLLPPTLIPLLVSLRGYSGPPLTFTPGSTPRVQQLEAEAHKRAEELFKLQGSNREEFSEQLLKVMGDTPERRALYPKKKETAKPDKVGDRLPRILDDLKAKITQPQEVNGKVTYKVTYTEQQLYQIALFTPLLLGTGTELKQEELDFLLVHLPKGYQELRACFPLYEATVRVATPDPATTKTSLEAGTTRPHSFQAYLPPSKPDPDPDRGIGFINGICQSTEASLKSIIRFSHLFGRTKPIYAAYNSTHGSLLDLFTAAAQKVLGRHIPAETQLIETWKDFFEAHPNGSFAQICHSQGTIITRQALASFKKTCEDSKPKKDWWQRISVVAVSPATALDPETCGHLTYIYNPLDVVPKLAGSFTPQPGKVDVVKKPLRPGAHKVSLFREEIRAAVGKVGTLSKD